jgi:hypothetical protein
MSDETKDNNQASQMPSDSQSFASSTCSVVNRQLCLKIFNAGYQAGHHDTVESIFKDDPDGLDCEYYHGERVNELIEDFLHNSKI